MKGMGNMMKQAQQLQSKMMKLQEELAEKTVESSSGGGMVTVVANGRHARTDYRVVGTYNDPAVVSRLECRLETGRTHQIRVHMAYIRHPLVGDPAYGGRLRLPKGADDALRATLSSFRRQALHAQRLELSHPDSGERLSWQAPLPGDMEALCEALRRHRDSSG